MASVGIIDKNNLQTDAYLLVLFPWLNISSVGQKMHAFEPISYLILTSSKSCIQEETKWSYHSNIPTLKNIYTKHN